MMLHFRPFIIAHGNRFPLVFGWGYSFGFIWRALNSAAAVHSGVAYGYKLTWVGTSCCLPKHTQEHISVFCSVHRTSSDVSKCCKGQRDTPETNVSYPERRMIKNWTIYSAFFERDRWYWPLDTHKTKNAIAHSYSNFWNFTGRSRAYAVWRKGNFHLENY